MTPHELVACYYHALATADDANNGADYHNTLSDCDIPGWDVRMDMLCRAAREAERVVEELLAQIASRYNLTVEDAGDCIDYAMGEQVPDDADEAHPGVRVQDLPRCPEDAFVKLVNDTVEILQTELDLAIRADADEYEGEFGMEHPEAFVLVPTR